MGKIVDLLLSGSKDNHRPARPGRSWLLCILLVGLALTVRVDRARAQARLAQKLLKPDAQAKAAPEVPSLARQASIKRAVSDAPNRAQRKPQLPPWLPRYDLHVHIDVEGHQVRVRVRVLWTNYHDRPARSIVFNNHSHYTVPSAEVGKFAKTLELLRITPSTALDFEGPPCTVQQVSLVAPASRKTRPLKFQYLKENDTALEIPLPFEVKKGQSVALELNFTLRLPQRQGRWGQWRGVTFLVQWLPVVAYYDNRGWQPAPFVPWHQPFHNEAGIYRATIVLPAEEKIGCTGSICSRKKLKNGWQEVKVSPIPARDFAILCSKRFCEVTGHAGRVKVRCLHLPEHAFYGKEMVRIAMETLPIYSEWFGPYPYKEFTVVESFFGWNGNECGGLVMIDERMFAMPHMAKNYVDSLLTHELCHQWWYNVVGTNGYAETWMDEGVVTHITHKVMDMKLGKNNPILAYPEGLQWLPNIYRNDFRNYGMFGTVGRGEATPTVQPLPKFGHLVTLSSMTYDRGSRIFGMIEHRLGTPATLEFMRHLYRKYYFRILHVADFQRELEAFTGQSWQEFFDNWLYGAGMSDWCLERVDIDLLHGHKARSRWLRNIIPRSTILDCFGKNPCKVVVLVRQRGKCNEPTVLGFRLDHSDNYQLRIPLIPGLPVLEMDECMARVETVAPDLMRVTVQLPVQPTQVSVDPDGVVLDREPANNHWIPRFRIRYTPVYSFLDETDVTTAHDRHNIIVGPWVYGSTYSNPWFTRSPLIGLRAGIYRTQQYMAGGYLAYRTNNRNIVAGIDGLIDHYPYSTMQFGFNLEKSLVTLSSENVPVSRAAVFARHVMLYGSSLYLPPFEYAEVYTGIQNRSLPNPRITFPGAKLFRDQNFLGVHYHKYYLTPYWDPEGGYALDVACQAGAPILGEHQSYQQIFGQFSTVKYMPDPLGILDKSPLTAWLKDTRFAFRFYGAAALPNQGQFFSLGGGNLFRGFDLSERQGSAVWIGSVEWRVPLVKGVNRDFCDHVMRLQNIYGVLFYDVGNAYLSGRQLGPVAHAVGASLRFDVTWLGLIERTMLRLDVAKTLNSDAPVQFWFGIQHPF